MKNGLSDLNNHLFAQLERLSEESLKGDDLKEEIERSKAVNGVAREITAGAKLMLEAQKALGHSVREGQLPEVLEVKRVS